MKTAIKIQTTPCQHCGSKRFIAKPGKGPHAAALYCKDCGRFHKWLSKRVAARLQQRAKQTDEATQTVSA